MTDTKWKSNLLSSSAPLEYEASRMLASGRFAVTADYKYSRHDGASWKDFSVDIEASGYLPLTDDERTDGRLSLLVECKYRKRGTSWLFFRDPNHPDLSPITLGRTIRVVDAFTTYSVPLDSTVPFDESLPHCYKGVEIDTTGGGVHDKELRHGVMQLQYALPRLMADHLEENVGRRIEECQPFYFCPILLTTAPLYVAREGISISAVEASNNLTEIADPVPYLMCYSDYGPDFREHCVTSGRDLTMPGGSWESTIASKRRSASPPLRTPGSFAQALQEGERYLLASLYTQFVVCSFVSFRNLLDSICKIVQSANGARVRLQ